MTLSMPPRLLLVEDDRDTASLICECLRDHFHADCVQHCTTVAQARAVDTGRIDLVLTDMNLPDGSGLDLMGELLQRRPDLPVVLVTGEGILDTAIAAIRLGAYDYVVKAGDYLFAIPLIVEKNLAIWRTKQDNLRLQDQLTGTLKELRVKNTQLEEAVQQLETMACTDPLTGLANRRALGQLLDRAFADARRHNRDLACLMIDLDGFKQFNDTLGHQKGDELLQLVAKVLEANCRRSDVAGRFGGDEFIVVLPRTDLETSCMVARRIAEEFDRAVTGLFVERRPRVAAPLTMLLPDGRGTPNDGAATATQATSPALAPPRPRISLSMGLASLAHSRPVTPEQLIAHADHALYRAKQGGKARLVIYTPAQALAAAPARTGGARGVRP